MVIYVANPLYDAVFKYMMEDERIAKTLLSALLQKTVIAVEMRRHEYPNISRDTISMFRVDFAATVLEDDGSKKLILIELQKHGWRRRPYASANIWLCSITTRRICVRIPRESLPCLPWRFIC